MLARDSHYHGDIAFNTQPGHIPERARVIARHDQAMNHLSMAEHHTAKAEGLADQLDQSIFSDDADAITALEARIAANEAKAEQQTAINKAYRKGGLAAIQRWQGSEQLVKSLAATMSLCPWLKVPYDLTNLRARIRADKERIAEIQRREGRKSQAADSPGGMLITGQEFIAVTFAEKPDREVLDALKAAGFSWSGGAWIGYRAKLPHMLTEVSS